MINMKLDDPMFIGFLDVAFSIWTGVFSLFLVIILPQGGSLDYPWSIIMFIGLANLPIFIWRLIKTRKPGYFFIALGTAIMTFIILFIYFLGLFLSSIGGPGF